MGKSQVLLIQMHALLGEGLQRILQTLDRVDLICLPCDEIQKIEACLTDIHPDVVLLAGEKEDDRSTHIISGLLKQYENIPIVWVELESNRLRFFTSHTLSATSAELLKVIQNNDAGQIEMQAIEKKSRSRMLRR